MRGGFALAKQVKTIKEKIINHHKIFEPTVRIYNEALSYFMEIINDEFVDLSIYTTKDMTNAVEKLTHATKANPSPKRTLFDTYFYKFPSYFRRSAIAAAFGKVKSYRSLYTNWENEKNIALVAGIKFNKKSPTLQMEHNEYPVFYQGNMFKRDFSDIAKIKFFINNDWVWVDIKVKPNKIEKRNVSDWKVCNPKLIKVGKKYFLATAYEKNIKLSNTKIKDQTIVTVDLGLTNSAVCSLMKSDGTVIDRLFINQSIEKDRLDLQLKKVKMAQREFGYIKAPNLWRRINGLQDHIKVDTARKIVDFAYDNDADMIVFEYLGNMNLGNAYGFKRLKQKLHHWCQVGIQSKTKEMAHYKGIRINRINPTNTSKLAFDGSGIVKRSAKKDLATFTTGKQYHADLNASYNIGARYFIREILKTFSKKKKSTLEAKVPLLSARTQQSLSTLISLHRAASLTA